MSSKKRGKQLDALKAADKRRQRRPEPKVQIIERITGGDIRRVQDKEQKLLSAIEARLYFAYQYHASFTDVDALDAVRTAIRGGAEARSPVAQEARDKLEEVRQHLADRVSQQRWINALRVVEKSIQTHIIASSPTAYLEFISVFLARATDVLDPLNVEPERA
jgi:hypothetical protein